MANIIKIIDGAPQVVDDPWVVVRDTDEAGSNGSLPQIVPFAVWHGLGEQSQPPAVQAIWIAPDDDFEPALQRLPELQLIAIDFPSFRDGRGYSIATLLRKRYGWRGELRAIGDILRDQLNYLRRCGFDAFALRADKDIHAALASFSRYSVRYQGAVDEPLPLFRRRSGSDAC